MLPTLLAALAIFAVPLATGPAAVSDDDAPHFCLFDEALELQLAADPTLADALRAQDEAAARALAKDRPSRMLEDYTLPVVVHVVSPPGTDTIALPDQVGNAIGFLNGAFANNAPFNPDEGVNTRTQFCLATRDPEGMPSTGITYTTSPLSDLQFELDDVPLKELVRWEPTEYINVYVVNEVATFSMGEINVEGYAYPPLFHGSAIDGIVIEADNFGTAAQETTPFVHQMGHYLGLYHTFEGACANDNCLLDGDRVCDTPPDQTTVAVPCDFDVNSCETDVNPADPNNPFDEDQFDLQNNYLDFSDLPCYDMFTLGQAERMQFFIEGPRSSLLESNSCLPPCPIDVVADFASNPTIVGDSIVLGAFINFFSTSTNADSLIWRLNGDSLTVNGSVDIQFDSVGTQTLVLTVFNDSSALCIDQFLVNYEVFCPVAAAFEVSDFYATPGQDILFTNTTTGATSYEWTVNGAVVSTDSNFVYAPPGLGTYEICLRAVGDLCEDVECVVLTCTSDGANCTSRAFLNAYSGPSLGVLGGVVVRLPSGNLLEAGSADFETYLREITEDGTVVWHRRFAALANIAQRPVDLMIDQEGFAVILGGINEANNGYSNYLVRYDLVGQQIDWARTYTPAQSGNRMFNAIAVRGATDYLLVGDAINDSGAVPKMYQVSSTDGAFTNQTPIDNWVALNDVTTGDSGDTYVSGVVSVAGDNDRFAVARLTDTLIEFDWARTYGPDASVPSNVDQPQLIVHDSTVVFVGQGNPFSTDDQPTQTFLTRLSSTDGEVELAYRIDVADYLTEAVSDVERLEDGYLVAGRIVDDPNNPNDVSLVFLRINDAGDRIWSTRIDDGMSPTTSPKGALRGDSYFFSAAQFQGATNNFNGLFGRLNLNDGNVGDEDCTEQNPVDFTLTILPNESQTYETTQTLEDDNAGTLVAITDQVGSLNATPLCAILCDEIACNFLDDDGDGLIDCCDPDAAGQACCLDFVPLEISPDGSDVFRACDNAAVVLNAGAGYQSYLWHDGSRDSVFTAYLPGTYWVTVESDNCGGIETDTVRIVDNNDLVAEIIPGEAQVCPGDTVFFELINPFESVNWLPADQVDCDTCRTTFTVVGEDPVEITGIGRYSTGCYSVDTLFITIQTLGSSETVQKCIGEAVDVFGEPQTEPGTYSMTFTSFDGCDSTATVNVQDFPLTTVNIAVETFCDGGAVFGNLTASASGGGGGPYTFAWEDGTTGPQLLNQPAGDYTVSVTDAEGCVNTQSATVEINLTVSVDTEPDCLDGEYAETATATGANGALPYEFTFSNGSSQLLPGTYSVTVSDANGCTASSNFDVADNASLSVGTSDVEVVCNDGLQATATALPEGGVAPYTYQWSTGTTTQTASDLVTGTNSVTVTDAAGCIEVVEVNVALQTIEGIELPNTILPMEVDNDIFAPVYEEGTDYEVQQLQIFNRWGQLIFESTDPDASWNGTRDGELVAMDVYVYRIVIGCGTDQGLEFFGDLTVIL